LRFPKAREDLGAKRFDLPTCRTNVELQLLRCRCQHLIAVVYHLLVEYEALRVKVNDTRGNRQACSGRDLSDVGDVESPVKTE